MFSLLTTMRLRQLPPGSGLVQDGGAAPAASLVARRARAWGFRVAGCDRQGPSYVRWLRSGSVLVGLGAAIVTGQGIATAAPSDSTHSGDTTSAVGNTGADGIGSSDDSSVTDVSKRTPASSSVPTSKASAQQITNPGNDDSERVEIKRQEITEDAAEQTVAVEDNTTTDSTAGDVTREGEAIHRRRAPRMAWTEPLRHGSRLQELP